MLFRKICLLVILFFLLLNFKASAQEKSKTHPFFPLKGSQNQSDFIRKIETEKEIIRNSGYFTSLKSYYVFREGNISLCDSERCREKVQDLFNIRYLAEGRCEGIQDRFLKELCFALKDNNCDNASEWRKDFCKGIIYKNPELLINISKSPSFIKDMKVTLADKDVLEIISFYYGFKYYSPILCEDFFKDSKRKGLLGRRLGCKILFYSQDPKEIIDSILRDLALFNISRKERNKEICESIKYREIKYNCLDTSIKTLDELF